jgi:sodium/proline symporter
VQTEHNGDALTLPDYFSSRFEDKSGLRIISAIVILVFFTIYCASGIVGRCPSVRKHLRHVLRAALWAGAAATIAYTFVGGFLAVSWTDTVQASLMIFALILTPIIVLISTGGDTTFLAIEAVNPAHFDMLKGATFIGIISLMGWGLGYFGQPHILARFMAADSVKSIANARRISMTWMILCLAAPVPWASSVSPTSRRTLTWPARSPRTMSACSSNWPRSCSTHGSPVCCCRPSWRR